MLDMHFTLSLLNRVGFNIHIALLGCSETDARLPVEAAQLTALRQGVADADARYRRLDEAHAATLAQLAAVRLEAAAATAAAAGGVHEFWCLCRHPCHK
jgi:hypothetical protein